MIVIVDYKLGNLGSVKNMLDYLGFECTITSDVEKVYCADKLIISGVGSFDKGIKNLHDLGLYEALQKKIKIQNTPVLGICLGMQLMGSISEEGTESGFNWIEGKAKRFDSEKVRIPHMSWNRIEMSADSRLFKGLENNSKFYFAHSFHLIPKSISCIIAESFYGGRFVAAIEYDNILGVQFHPEKSHKYGMKLLSNFITEY